MVEGGRAREAGQRRPAAPPRLLLVLGAWALLVASIQLYAWYEMLTPGEVLQHLVMLCRVRTIGPLLFVGMAALSPLLLLPAALLGGVAGACFGPALGVCYTLLGCNLSALLTYGLGRLSRQEHGSVARMCARYGPGLQSRPFLSVLLLRLSFLPYDPVNYLIGMRRVRPWPFLLANTLGSLPGVMAIVLAGNALGNLGADTTALSPTILLSAVALMAVSVGLAVLLRERGPTR